MAMTLGELIKTLEAEDPAKVVPAGFRHPHSYRGYYDELAFEPAADVTVGEMLKAAKAALGTTYCGWKGGEYTMGEYTPVWLSQVGYASGESIGPTLLAYMLGKASRVERGAELRAVELRGVRAGLEAAAKCVEGRRGPDGGTLPDGDEGLLQEGWNNACEALPERIRAIDPAAVDVAGGPKA